jgi:HSP20 family molecular chaperone IbpA
MAKDNDERIDVHTGEGAGEGADAQTKVPAEQSGSEPTRSRPSFRPRVDIYETEKGLVLLADLPGAKAEAIEIGLERRELTLRAPVEDAAPEGLSPLYREYAVGDYERRFQLSGDFDTEAIEARYSDGVLKLTIPTAPQAQARRIEIAAG